MDEIQMRTADMVDAGQAAIQQASQLAVTYSFSFIGAIFLLLAGYLLSNVVERSIYAGLGRFRGFDETLRKFFSKVARYALLILVGVTVLAQFGVQTASIIAALGAVGLAVGLALQGTLQNIAAGIMLLALRPVRVGEFVQAGGISGTVQEIGLFATEMQTGDGVYMLVPNSQLWNTPVTNFSRNARRAHNLTVRISYEDDIDLALKTMSQLVQADERVLTDPAPHAYLGALADDAVEVTVRYWTGNSDWWQTQLDLTKAVKLTFDKREIRIPLPQQEVRYIPQLTNGEDAAIKPGERG